MLGEQKMKKNNFASIKSLKKGVGSGSISHGSAPKCQGSPTLLSRKMTYQAKALGVGRGEDFRAGDSLTHVTQSHVLLVFARLHTKHSLHKLDIYANMGRK
jgi:hypothetical protein